MWQRWSATLEWLGRFRFGISGRAKLTVGQPGAADALGSTDWSRFARAEPLYDVWGPHPLSRWVPFHSVPLFAALDRIPAKSIGPAAPPEAGNSADWRNRLPDSVQPDAPPPPFLSADCWIILDLPGTAVIQTAVWLLNAGCQPVCTFDNWPHPRGLLRSEDILAEMLRWAGSVARLRPRMKPDSPPLWICDSQRLGERGGKPGEFDNRYFLDDSVLPGIATLRDAGIRRVVYITLTAEDMPVLDLEPYFTELLTAGLSVQHLPLSSGGLEPAPFAAPPARRPLKRRTFRRSAAGGFGTEVPQPSSGGGG
jgi:hypothetical protein